jgi:hypothetical protein
MTGNFKNIENKVYESDACCVDSEGVFYIVTPAQEFDFDWLCHEVESAKKAVEKLGAKI